MTRPVTDLQRRVAPFEVIAPFQPSGDQPTAIAELTDAARALGANAVVGIDLDYENVGANGGMLMVTASGTAVRI